MQKPWVKVFVVVLTCHNLGKLSPRTTVQVYLEADFKIDFIGVRGVECLQYMFAQFPTMVLTW